MGTAFEQLVELVRRSIKDQSYSKNRLWSLISRQYRSGFRKGLVRLEDGCVILSLLGTDGTEYLYWACFSGDQLIEHQSVHRPTGDHRDHARARPDPQSFIQHLQPGPRNDKLKFLDFATALPPPLPRHHPEVKWHFQPKNSIERHAKPARTKVSYTPINHDFIETPEVSNSLP